jgi:hypothetical protein
LLNNVAGGEAKNGERIILTIRAVIAKNPSSANAVAADVNGNQILRTSCQISTHVTSVKELEWFSCLYIMNFGKRLLIPIAKIVDATE